MLDGIISDKRDIKNQLGTYSQSDVRPVLTNFSSRARVRRLWTKQFFMDPADSFVLGSSTLAILGQSKLGDRSVEVGNFVLPHRNVVEEDLLDFMFIDTEATTATVKVD